MPLTAADLDRIEALAKGATPGKRVVQYDATVKDRAGSIYLDPVPVGEDGSPEWWDAKALFLGYSGGTQCYRADADFIAALDPNTVLALVEAARRDVPALLRAMPTDDARLEAMYGICRHCGRIEDENESGGRGCQCWNDD